MCIRDSEKALIGSFELEDYHFQDFYHNPSKSRIYKDKKLVYVSELTDKVWETKGIRNDEGSFDKFITFGPLDTDSLMCSCTLFKDYKIINSIFMREDTPLDFTDRDLLGKNRDLRSSIDIEYKDS